MDVSSEFPSESTWGVLNATAACAEAVESGSVSHRVSRDARLSESGARDVWCT